VTNTAAAKTPSTISTNAAWAAMGATLTYQVLLGALIFLRPDLDPSWHSISEWAIGPHRWIMSCAFLVSSVSYACLFVMLRTELGKPMGRIGLGILLICARRCRCRYLYNRSDALSSPFIDEGYPSRYLRYHPVGAVSLCGPAHWPESCSGESNMGKGVQTPDLVGLAALVRVRRVCGLYEFVCCPYGPACLWPRGQHRLAAAVCIFHLHAVDTHRGIAGNQVLSSAF
jgi:hypothetical protein